MDKTTVVADHKRVVVTVKDLLDALRKTVENLESLPLDLEVQDGEAWVVPIIPMLTLIRY